MRSTGHAQWQEHPASGAAAAIERVGLTLVEEGWVFSITSTPDAWLVEDDGALVIDDEASSGRRLAAAPAGILIY